LGGIGTFFAGAADPIEAPRSEAHERVELARSVGEAGEREHAQRDRDLPRDRMRERCPDVGESETVGPMNGLVCFRARGHDAHGDRVETRVAQPPQSDGRRAVRFQMDRPESRALADRDDRVLDQTDREERLVPTRTPECDDGASALEVARRRIRELVGRRPECGGFRRRRVGVVVQDEHLDRSLVPRRGDWQRAIVTSEESVRRRAAPIVLRTTGELT